jgi:hypothetical protein
MSQQSHSYLIQGLAVRSNFPIPGGAFLAPASATDPVVIEMGQVPDRLADAEIDEPERQVAASAYLRHFPGVCRLLITEGRHMLVQPEPGCAHAAMINLVANAGIAVAGYQRGHVPFHASSVAVHGQAAAFAGNSGAGKSTLAAALAQRGHSWLSDDLCLVRLDADAVRVGRGLPSLRLCYDAAEHLGQDYRAARGTRQQDGKSSFASGTSGEVGDLPLRRIYLPRPLPSGEAPRIRRIDPVDALTPLVDALKFTAGLLVVGAPDRAFRSLVQIANRVELFTFERPWTLDAFESALDLLEEHFETQTAPA